MANTALLLAIKRNVEAVCPKKLHDIYLKEIGTFTVPYVMEVYSSISRLSELSVGVIGRKDSKSLVLLLLIKRGLYKFLLSFLIQMKLLKVDEQLFLAQTGENTKDR